MISKWKNRFELNNLEIKTEKIDPKSVVYPDDCQGEDRFFIGISINKATSTAIIYHDRPLTEEDIVHELLHVKHPEWSEEQVNSETKQGNMKTQRICICGIIGKGRSPSDRCVLACL